MRHLNYHHLLYFWTVASEGSIARAAEVLHLTPQTISTQLKTLEGVIGAPLFHRVGRGLVLSETGRLVMHYADDIFSLGAELAARIGGDQSGVSTPLNVGVVDSIPKLIAGRILGPVLADREGVRLVCREGDLDEMLSELAVHRLDLVISDRPVPTGMHVKAYSHLLGESSISFFSGKQGDVPTSPFPDCLDQAPMLLPVHANAVRRSLDEWFEREGLTPLVVAEFEDSALLKAFGEAGMGHFPAPTAIAEEIAHMYHARLIGTAESVRERYFAISPERKLRDPAVIEITRNARHRLFG